MQKEKPKTSNELRVRTILTILIVICAVRQFINDDYQKVFICFLSLFLLGLPRFIEKKLDLDLPPLVYFLRLKKIKESFTDFTIEERLEHCKRVIADRHFFMRECLVSFEIPLRIYHDDIEKVRCFYRISFGRYLCRNYYMQINTKDKKVYLLTRFVSGTFIFRRRYNTETELIFDKITGFLSKANPDIEISRLSPEHEFFRRLFKKRP